MSIRDNMLNNPNQLLTTFFFLIDDEKKRIVSCKLVDNEQLSLFYNPIKNSIIKNAQKHRDWRIIANQLSSLHNVLKSIQLPGDLEEYIESPDKLGEQFYVALDVPYDGDQFYDLSSIMKEKEEHKGDEKNEKKDDDEKEDATEEKHMEECECMSCTADDESEKILVSATNKYLTKIAHHLGGTGNHEAAYLVEKTIKSIAQTTNK